MPSVSVLGIPADNHYLGATMSANHVTHEPASRMRDGMSKRNSRASGRSWICGIRRMPKSFTIRTAYWTTSFAGCDRRSRTSRPSGGRCSDAGPGSDRAPWGTGYAGASVWLQDFVVRMDVGPTLFLPALISNLAIALLIVGGRSLRAARISPVEALRHE